MGEETQYVQMGLRSGGSDLAGWRRDCKRAHIVDGGIDGGPQRLRIAGRVREQGAALMRGNQ